MSSARGIKLLNDKETDEMLFKEILNRIENLSDTQLCKLADAAEFELMDRESEDEREEEN